MRVQMYLHIRIYKAHNVCKGGGSVVHVMYDN